MPITFTGQRAINSETFGINFEAYLDGHRITCLASQEALQDVDPENRFAGPLEQFDANRAVFEDLARRKITEALPTRISIGSSDVSR